MAVNAPALLVLTVVGVVVTVVPSYWRIIEFDEIKPNPVTSTLLPLGPFDGSSVINDPVTVNMAEAELVPSEIVTLCEPSLDGGTVKVAVNTPLLSALIDEGLVTGWPSNLVTTGCNGIKFIPVTVTVVPTAPLVGLNVIEELFTVNVAVAELPDASVAVTVSAPIAASLGIIIDPLNVPSPATVIGDVTMLLLALPVIVTVTASPL